MSGVETRAQQGFSLLEVVVVIVLMGSLLVALTNIQIFTLERSNDTQDQEERLALAHTALNDMQQAIRYSNRVAGASTNVLKVHAAHVVDFDDDVETIRYSLSDGNLIKVVEDTGGTTVETILEDVASFRAYTMEIQDRFSIDDYAGVVNSFALATTDTANEVTYRVIDVVDIDSTFSDCYDSDNERLSLATALGPKSLTVTPNMSKQGLSAQIEFTPEFATQEYQVLRYGDPASAAGAVVIVFRSDSGIALRRIESGAVVAESAATTTWSALTSHSVKLVFRDGKVAGVISKDGAAERIGIIDWGNMNNQPIDIETTSVLSRGHWDDLWVSYPEVELEVTYNVNAQPRILVGGATRRYIDE